MLEMELSVPAKGDMQWHFKAELSGIAPVVWHRMLTGIDFTLWRPGFVYSVAKGGFGGCPQF